MKNIKSIFLILLLVSTVIAAQTKWKFDKAHTTIGFSVTHLVITEVEGKFKKFGGKIITPGDDFENAQVEFWADVNSISTENKKRDKHLKSDDFFNAEKFPKLTFKSKSFKKVGEKKYKLVGDLTIRDKTKEVELDVTHNGTIKDPLGNTRAGFKIEGEINRFDFGLKWNKLMELGGAVVGKTVRIKINTELKKVE